MTTGMDTKNISDAGKTTIVNNELLRLNVDIAALQETRLASQGSMKENVYPECQCGFRSKLRCRGYRK